ncbi:hypothetical protein Sjap_001765 [Stephania japonica]|uniref:Uncharacterized protein n=1 Tax=Stephania japonica TaxID=461633 RepID=A0AAP0PTK7_9MAGN
MCAGHFIQLHYPTLGPNLVISSAPDRARDCLCRSLFNPIETSNNNISKFALPLKMLKRNREEEPRSSLSTIEEIERRLVRPSCSSPTQSSSIRSLDPAISRAKNGDIGPDVAAKTAKTTKKKKLEDYLDPVILSAIRAQLNQKPRKQARIRKSPTISIGLWKRSS